MSAGEVVGRKDTALPAGLQTWREVWMERPTRLPHSWVHPRAKVHVL